MNKFERVEIQYTKSEDDVTNRTIIPISLPKDLITSIDVTGMDDDQVSVVEAEYTRYNEYRERHMRQLFSFTDWLEHTNSPVKTEDLKFRSFKPEKVTLIK